MILVDTSVWVNHLRVGSLRLQTLLEDGQLLIHPYVIGELACGMLKNRVEIISLLQTLPEALVPEHHEVLYLLESQKFFGLRLGWVDISLLASAQLTGCGLWTVDVSLKNAATKLRLPNSEPTNSL